MGNGDSQEDKGKKDGAEVTTKTKGSGDAPAVATSNPPSQPASAAVVASSTDATASPASTAAQSDAAAAGPVEYGGGGAVAAPSSAPVSGPDAAPAPHPTLSNLPPAQSLAAAPTSAHAPAPNSWFAGPQRAAPIRLTREAIAQTALMWQRPPIGKGGFSSVHEGVFYNAPVAVKVLTLRDESERAMFNEELRALLNPALWHPNITPLLAFCDTHPAFVFPKLVPITADRLSRLPLQVRDYVCRDAALGLAHMHSAGYVHSDMKPDNVLLDFDQNRVIRRALVGDMGCVKSCAVPVMPFGTIIYMDPVMSGGTQRYPHPMDDVYALGVTVLAIYTGIMPKTAEDVLAMDDTLARMDPFRSQLARSMLQPNRNLRPHCNAVAATLQSVIARQGVVPPLAQPLLPSIQVMATAAASAAAGQQPQAPLATAPAPAATPPVAHVAAPAPAQSRAAV